MQEANPYPEQTVFLDEARPGAAALPDVRAIHIGPRSTGVGGKALVEEIDAVLAALPCHNVELLAIDYNSSLQRLPDLNRFSNLRHLHVGGRKIRAVGDLSSLSRLESLFVANPQVIKLSDLKVRRLGRLRLIRGSVEVVDVPVSGWALLQNCLRLRRLGVVEIRRLTLESCRSVDLQSLGDVTGLKKLDLLGHGRLHDFDFLARCEDLVSLTITATQVSSAHYDGLGRCPSLRCVFLAVGEARLRAIAADYPGIVFGNGDVSFKGAQKLDGSAYYDACDGLQI